MASGNTRWNKPAPDAPRGGAATYCLSPAHKARNTTAATEKRGSRAMRPPREPVRQQRIGGPFIGW